MPTSEKIERVKTSLQLEEDINLHEKSWIIQRVGWCLMLIFLICAALGLFGDGILSKTQITQACITVRYEKYYRYETDTELEIHSTGQGTIAEVIVPQAFTTGFEIVSIVPQPSQQSIDNGAIRYSFSAAGAGHVTFFIRAMKTGTLGSNIRVNDKDFAVETFIYP